VQDHADRDKDDRYRKYAIEASYRFLAEFLRKQIEPRQSPSFDPHPGGFPYAGLTGVLFVLLLTPLVAEQWARALDNPLAALLAPLLAISALVLALSYSRYFGILGASCKPASLDWQSYDTLRQSLATGGRAVGLYSRWLTAFLDSVDRFFGDTGMADRTLFTHAFGLKVPAPLWTAPAYDRCLLLAVLYPIVTIFIVWAVSGNVGPAEKALGLSPGLPGGLRGLVVAALASSAFVGWRFIQSVRNRTFRSTVSFALAFALAVTVVVAFAEVAVVAFIEADTTNGVFAVVSTRVGAIARAGSIAFVFTIAVTLAVVFTGVVAVASIGAGVLASAVAFAFADPDAKGGGYAMAIAGAGFVAGIGVIAGAGAVYWLSNTAAIRNRWRGVFLLLFFVVMTSSYLVAASILSSWLGWPMFGPFMLFLGLLPLLNAPFDWASLGLTRALLRRGLELKGWWPFFLALADALAAGVIVALLAISMVLGVQTFDALVAHNGTQPLLPLIPAYVSDPDVPALLDSIEANPGKSEYWWVYTLLLSTMIPSVINLVISGTALMRAVPGVSPGLLAYLPAYDAVRTFDRAWIAAVLTGQVALGAILGVAAQLFLAYGLIFHAMPAVGLGLLDVARNLAALDLPMQLIRLLAGTP
jgi:hypothetical protein